MVNYCHPIIKPLVVAVRAARRAARHQVAAGHGLHRSAVAHGRAPGAGAPGAVPTAPGCTAAPGALPAGPGARSLPRPVTRAAPGLASAKVAATLALSVGAAAAGLAGYGLLGPNRAGTPGGVAALPAPTSLTMTQVGILVGDTGIGDYGPNDVAANQPRAGSTGAPRLNQLADPQVTSVPEPASLALLLMGAAGAAVIRRRPRR